MTAPNIKTKLPKRNAANGNVHYRESLLEGIVTSVPEIHLQKEVNEGFYNKKTTIKVGDEKYTLTGQYDSLRKGQRVKLTFSYHAEHKHAKEVIKCIILDSKGEEELIYKIGPNY